MFISNSYRDKYLVTGGSGRLGTELQKHLAGGFYPPHGALDITDKYNKPYGHIDAVVHLAAYTNVDKAEKEPQKCFDVNVIGTYNMLVAYQNKPFVFISTEHVNAEGVYFQSKLIGEMLVRNLASQYLIIRTLFKPNPYPWDNAWIDQMTQGDYVDVIATLIAKEVTDWKGKSKCVYVGTGRKSIYELAVRTNPDVRPSSVKDVDGLKRPVDYI